MKRTSKSATSEIACGANDPSNSLRLIGEIEDVLILLLKTKALSIKLSVEPESRSVGRERECPLCKRVRSRIKERSSTVKEDALSFTSFSKRTRSTQSLLRLVLQELRTIFPPSPR